jgi:hypothetical protein
VLKTNKFVRNIAYNYPNKDTQHHILTTLAFKKHHEHISAITPKPSVPVKPPKPVPASRYDLFYDHLSY